MKPLPIVTQLRDERIRQRLTQAKVAQRAYVSAGAIGCYEAGHNNPSVNALMSWAAALGYQLTLTPTHVRVDQPGTHPTLVENGTP